VVSWTAALAFVCVLTFSGWSASPFPANISVDPPLNDMIAAMLPDSPTLRDQLRRLGMVGRLRMQMLVDPLMFSRRRTHRAECVIRRYEYGRIDAIVRFRSQRDAAEFLGHELEHVLESAEGVNYAVLAARQPREVWMVSDGHFETARAIHAGRRVAREIAGGRSARVH